MNTLHAVRSDKIKNTTFVMLHNEDIWVCNQKIYMMMDQNFSFNFLIFAYIKLGEQMYWSK